MTKQSAKAGHHATIYQAGGNILISSSSELVDSEISRRLSLLKKSRFYAEADNISSAASLGESVSKGKLSGGTDSMRAQALAWCSRILTRKDRIGDAERYYEIARELCDSEDVTIARAFLKSANSDMRAALNILGEIDTLKTHSARLMIAAHHKGGKDIIDWASDAGIGISNLDADGKCVFLGYQIEQERWDELQSTIRALTDQDFRACPVLFHYTALSSVIVTVPEPYRDVVLSAPPFELHGFPLSSHASAMAARRRAQSLFLEGAKAAQDLHCTTAAKLDDEYAIWLELMDPDQYEAGKSRLKDRLGDPAYRLGYVHYALQVGIDVNLDLVENEIRRVSSKNGGMTIDCAKARFALSFTQETPRKIAEYLSRYRDQISEHISQKVIGLRIVEMLARAALIEPAYAALDELKEHGLESQEEEDLRLLISEAEGTDPLESRYSLYKSSKRLNHLINLVKELERGNRWLEIRKYGKILFDRTGALSDARRLVDAFIFTGDYSALVEFLENHLDIVDQDEALQLSYAWGLYYEGQFLRSQVTMSKLTQVTDSRNYRALQVNLAVSLGDWEALSSYIEYEFKKRHERTPEELLSTSKLAVQILPSRAKELLHAAVEKADADPAVLSSAYVLATSAGWEETCDVHKWLERAKSLSDDKGPLQTLELSELAEKIPEWDRRSSATWRSLEACEIPIFAAAQALNKSFLDLTLYAGLTNLSQPDPRQRRLVPCFSGRNVGNEVDVLGGVAALDVSALLNLGFLGILDQVLTLFEHTNLPHSTLRWLFTEHGKASFHQPSRVSRARRMLEMFSEGRLERFRPTATPSSELSALVGDELAAMIAEAEAASECSDAQHIVVRPSPVYRVSSLMSEKVDLSEHSDVLCSCSSIVEKLRDKGALTSPVEVRSLSFLKLQEEKWNESPEIEDGATLYLDDLSVSYFNHLGLLEKLSVAGFTAVISNEHLNDCNDLVAYERTSNKIQGIIDRTRSLLLSLVEQGRVSFCRKQTVDQGLEDKNAEQPAFDFLQTVGSSELAVIDDRFFNRHRSMEHEGCRIPVISTLDILDAMERADHISYEEGLEYRTRLRQAGYSLIPIGSDELQTCLLDSAIENSEIRKASELKAIEDSILLLRMTNYLQLPDESAWLNSVVCACASALKRQWEIDNDFEDAAAFSSWLLAQMDLKFWLHCFPVEQIDTILDTSRAGPLLLLLVPPDTREQACIDAYWDWLESAVLLPAKEQFPKLFEHLLDQHREYVEQLLRSETLESGDSS